MGSKSSFSIARFCTTSRRIPARARTNQGPQKGDLVPQVLINRIADRAMHVVSCENAALMLVGQNATGVADLWTKLATQVTNSSTLERNCQL